MLEKGPQDDMLCAITNKTVLNSLLALQLN